MASLLLQPIADESLNKTPFVFDSTSAAKAIIPSVANIIERVFPIRLPVGQEQYAAVFSNQPSSSSHSATPDARVDGEKGLALQPVSALDDSFIPLFSSLPTALDSGALTVPQHVSTLGERYITNKHIFGSPTHVSPSPSIVKDQKHYRCEDEPIHIPGAIQRFGALVAVRQDDDGLFKVRIASENTETILGHGPEVLFNLLCFTDALNADDKIEFLVRVNALRTNIARTDPDVYTLSLTSVRGIPIRLFCAMHLSSTEDLIICEFEKEKDIFLSNHPPNDGFPDVPISVIDHIAPTQAARNLSTTSRSNPLHAVNIARKSSRQLGAMDLFHILSEVQTQMSRATELPALLDTIVGLVYELTSFHRVMVYQFDETAAE
jgi:hypothetical protein